MRIELLCSGIEKEVYQREARSPVAHQISGWSANRKVSPNFTRFYHNSHCKYQAEVFLCLNRAGRFEIRAYKKAPKRMPNKL
jgi:hypothetical protein